MKIGIIGLGRMGANIARRLIRHGHDTIVYNRSPEPVAELVREGAVGASGLADMRSKLDKPAIYWVMLPAGKPTEAMCRATIRMRMRDNQDENPVWGERRRA
jgi:6-phosphogluconate dehydrogenase